MELFVNDLSIHGQFHDLQSFRGAFGRLMAMRAVARHHERDVHCHRALLTVEPLPGVSMRQAIGCLSESERRSAMRWLTKGGPFWDDLRRHGSDDWLECRGDVVTDSVVGEAAYRKLHGIECGLVGVVPSDWDFSPVEVAWRREAEGLEDRQAALENWRAPAALENGLRAAAPPVRSWGDLRNASVRRFTRLTFADNAFQPLDGSPFSASASERILILLSILDRLSGAFDQSGRRTPEGNRIHQDHFRGRNALFSDSSPTERHNFRDEMTFPDPGDAGGTLFCPWHGKVRSPTLRLHFWWSFRSGEPVCIVYVGPKITRR